MNVQSKLPKKLSAVLALTIAIFAMSFALTWFVINTIQTARNMVTIGIVGHPTRINPLLTTGSTVDMMIISLLYEPLIEFNSEHNPVGILADTWDLDETGKVYTIHLKDDATWSDGTPVTAQDVVFSYMLTQKEDYTGREKNRFSGVVITPVSEKTVTFTLEEVFAPFLESLTLRVIPKHIWDSLTIKEMKQSPYNLDPVASGEHYISNLVVKDETVTEIEISKRSDKKPISKLVFYESSAELNEAYSLGDIDSFITQSPETQQLYSNWENTLIAESPICGQSISMYVNTAWQESIDQYDSFINAIYSTLGTTTQLSTLSYSSLPPAHWAYKENTTITAVTPEEIKNTFNNFSSENPINIVIVTNPDIHLHVENLLAPIRTQGLPFTVKAVDAAIARTTILPERAFDILIIPQQLTHDPDVYAFWHSTQTELSEGELNISGYENRQMDKALEEGRTTLDREKRISSYEIVQDKLFEEKLAIFMNHPPIVEITRVNSPTAPIKECLWYTSDYLKAKFN